MYDQFKLLMNSKILKCVINLNDNEKCVNFRGGGRCDKITLGFYFKVQKNH